jgi:DNA-binding XRE family transcriptional regulator
MLVKYNIETNLLYVHFFTGVPNVQMPTNHPDAAKFVAKSNKDQVIGYEIENASENMSFILEKLGLNRKQKLAIVLCYLREKDKKTQKEFSTIINVSESTYKSLERAEHNIGFDTLDIIYNQFKKEKMLFDIFSIQTAS